ncbi:cytochrome c biogenesis protein CcsA [Leyella stercorea]|uniref:cytochrome c biogenesis protein CcsA n=1 Tax=Leyella stercorea TaxID=363265 RepID=UPI001F3F6B71|nr:cytochrome c biogenesis protein CcsA [Leyella stercorea]MCF2615378.1 cytochrome c biogenesis protein CcsA [Leyella stercorea]
MQNPLKKTLFALYVLVIVCMAAATVVEKYSGTDFVRSNVYGAWWFSLLWAVLTAVGVVYFLRHRCKSWSGIALHLSLVVILAGAFVTHVSSERGTVHLCQGAYISTCVMYDRHNQPYDAQMPFQMRLDRFDVQYHEGTDAAEDYVSQFTIIDHGKQYSGKVSMNRIFRYGAMRFYQSSYDNDMLGASVSFNSDPIGIPLTYTGYALLFFSLVYMLFDPHGAYRKLLRLSHLKKGLMMMALRSGSLLKLFSYTNKGKTTWFAPTDDLPNAMDREHQQFVRSICLLLGDCALASDYTQMDAVVGKMLKYQQKNGGASMPFDRRVAAERIYNRIPFATILFMLCLAMGIISFLYAIIRMCREDNGASNGGTDADPVRKKRSKRLHLTFFGASYAVLLLSFCALTYCEYLRWTISGTLPMTNGYETMLFVAWLVQLLALVCGVRLRLLVALGFLMSGFFLLVSHIGQMYPQIKHTMPVLNSPLLSVHVSIIMMGFAMLSFTFISGLTALLLRLVSRTAQPKMVQLQQLSLVFLYPALAALGIGIFIGAIWANVSWGEYWGWDPKEVWALITFMIYAIPLHARSVAQLRRPTAFHLFMTLAFMTLVMTYFGVNYFLGGMHSYA